MLAKRSQKVRTLNKRVLRIGKSIVHIGFHTIYGLEHPLGSWNMFLEDKERQLYCKLVSSAALAREDSS